MPLILALEPNRVQASRLSSVGRSLHADLVLVTTTDRALHTLSDRVPDLILIPALLSSRDETCLTDRLRELGTAASHVQTLTIPILAAETAPQSRGVLKGLRRGKTRKIATDGCHPEVFGAQISEYLARAEEVRLASEAVARQLAERQESSVSTSAPEASDAFESSLVQFEDPMTPEKPTRSDFEAIAYDNHPDASAEQPEPVTLQDEAPAIADYALAIGDQSDTFEQAPNAVDELPLSLGVPSPVFEEHEYHAIAFEEDAVVLEQPVALQEETLTLDHRIVAFPEQAEPPALTGPPVMPDESFVFRMPIVADDSWPEPPSIAAPEPETISLTEAAAVSPNDVPQIEAVIAPDPELTESGAWWLSASIDDGLQVALETCSDDDTRWMLTPLDDLPAEVVSEGPTPKLSGGARHAAPVSLEVVFPSPEIITVHEDACATLVIPPPLAAAGEPASAAVRSAPEDLARRGPDAARRKGDTTRRRKIDPPVQDEWGLFDPSKCGFSALLEKLDEMTTEKAERPDISAYVRVVSY